MHTSQYDELCQAFDIISRDTMHSSLFLRFAVLNHLNSSEQAVLMGLWDRSSRFGHHDPVPLTYTHLITGQAPNYCGRHLMPIPNVSRSRFFLSLQALRKLGIIAKYGIRGHLITCYPRNYIDDKERLINSLKQDKQRGLPLLASIEEAILHYMNHVEYFSAKVAKGPKLRVVEKVENT